MKQILISQFKEQCIALLKQAQRVGEGFVVTIRGTPLARIEPISSSSDYGKRPLGASVDVLTISGDVVHHDSSAEWEALK